MTIINDIVYSPGVDSFTIVKNGTGRYVVTIPKDPRLLVKERKKKT